MVAMIGDITGPDGWPDGKVDVRDVAKVAKLFGVNYPDPKCDANGDIAHDLKIDLKTYQQWQDATDKQTP
jgi:hypothetical protein